MDLVVDGQSSKSIARTLGISYRTVELHRNHIFDKLGVQSVAELVRLVVETPRAVASVVNGRVAHGTAPA